jgi:hypothetical protein
MKRGLENAPALIDVGTSQSGALQCNDAMFRST